MPEVPEEYREVMLFASGKIQELLRPEVEEDVKLVQKGLLLYRQGLVRQVKVDFDTTEATVQDVTPVQVTIDHNFLELSTCSCPIEGLCRHQLAAFFAAFSKIGSVSDWVESWREPIRKKQEATQWGLKRARDLLKTAGKLQPDYDRWVSTFHESFDAIMKGTGPIKAYVVAELFEVYSRRVKAGAPLEREWRLLYELIGSVTSFIKLSELTVELNHDREQIERFYRHVFFSIVEDVENCLQKLASHSLPFAFDAFIQRLKADSLQLLNGTPTVEFAEIYAYRMLWENLFKNKTWYKQEQERLQPLIDQENIPFTKRFCISMGYVYLSIFLREDEKALQYIKAFEITSVPTLGAVMNMLIDQKAWERMSPFVLYYIEIIKPYLGSLHEFYKKEQFANETLALMDAYCSAMKRHDLYENVLVQLLPFSYYDYSEFLFYQEKFDKWSELQGYMKISVDMLDNGDLREVQNKAPEALVPLYHQTIQDLINQKSRDHYRMAVRLLKKLRTLYKKQKNEADWVFFLNQLLEKTKRLRAFQEECKRGKLIDA